MNIPYKSVSDDWQYITVYSYIYTYEECPLCIVFRNGNQKVLFIYYDISFEKFTRYCKINKNRISSKGSKFDLNEIPEGHRRNSRVNELLFRLFGLLEKVYF